jgi:integrase
VIRRVPGDCGRWQAYGRRGGKKVYIGTFDSEREARSAERRHIVTQEQIAAGELPPDVDFKRTLKQAAEDWLDSLEASKSRSHGTYGEFMRYQILPRVGSASIARFTKAQVMGWRDDVATDYAPTTVNSALACLSSAFSYFVDRGWLAANPCRGVSRIEVHERSYNWIKTRGELERLLGVCTDELRDMIAFAVATGVRIDEQLHLEWTDIDLERRLITVQRGEQGTVKGGRLRHVPILDAVLDMLKARALKRGGAVLVFPGKAGKVRDKPAVRRALRAALGRAGMDTKLRWHDLRHTCASWWVLAAGDIFRLSKLLGHASVTITEQWYAHLAPEAWQQDYARLAFHVPTEPAKIYEFKRDENGKLAGRRVIAGGETGEKPKTALEGAA